MTIYICDDSRSCLLMIAEILSSVGEIRSFLRVADLLEAVRSKRPDVMVLDISMPDLDAFDLLRGRSLPGEVPIVLVSATAVYLRIAEKENAARWHRRLEFCSKDRLLDLPQMVFALINQAPSDA